MSCVDTFRLIADWTNYQPEHFWDDIRSADDVLKIWRAVEADDVDMIADSPEALRLLRLWRKRRERSVS